MSGRVSGSGEGRGDRDGLMRLLWRLLRRRAVGRIPLLLPSLSRMGDFRQAAVYLGEWLRPLPPPVIAAVLDAALEWSRSKRDGSDLAVQAILSPELKASWPKGMADGVVAAARRAGTFDLAVMLVDLPEPDPRFDAPPGKVALQLSKVPLGMRKSWARRQDIYLMERLLSDPDVAVVTALLDNPRLTVREVVRLAAEGDARPEILESIALSARWIPRYEVKLAIVYNPATPARVSLGLLRLLLAQDLRAVSKDGRLNGVVRRRASELLAKG